MEMAGCRRQPYRAALASDLMGLLHVVVVVVSRLVVAVSPCRCVAVSSHCRALSRVLCPGGRCPRSGLPARSAGLDRAPGRRIDTKERVLRGEDAALGGGWQLCVLLLALGPRAHWQTGC